jgi:hypothetical protein
MGLKGMVSWGKKITRYFAKEREAEGDIQMQEWGHSLNLAIALTSCLRSRNLAPSWLMLGVCVHLALSKLSVSFILSSVAASSPLGTFP